MNRELAVVSHMMRLAADPQGLNLIQSIPCRIRRLRERESKTVYLSPTQAKSLLSAAGA